MAQSINAELTVSGPDLPAVAPPLRGLRMARRERQGRCKRSDRILSRLARFEQVGSLEQGLDAPWNSPLSGRFLQGVLCFSRIARGTGSAGHSRKNFTAIVRR